jgi:hypothetical protein
VMKRLNFPPLCKFKKLYSKRGFLANEGCLLEEGF